MNPRPTCSDCLAPSGLSRDLRGALHNSQVIPLDNAGGVRAPESNYPNCVGCSVTTELAWPAADARNTYAVAHRAHRPAGGLPSNTPRRDNPEHSPSAQLTGLRGLEWPSGWPLGSGGSPPRPPVLPPSLPREGAGHSPWHKKSKLLD